MTYRLPEVLRRFQTVYPGIQLTLIPRSDSQKQIEEVVDGTVDLGVIVDERVRSKAGRIHAGIYCLSAGPTYRQQLHIPVAVRARPERGRGLVEKATPCSTRFRAKVSC